MANSAHERQVKLWRAFYLHSVVYLLLGAGVVGCYGYVKRQNDQLSQTWFQVGDVERRLVSTISRTSLMVSTLGSNAQSNALLKSIQANLEMTAYDVQLLLKIERDSGRTDALEALTQLLGQQQRAANLLPRLFSLYRGNPPEFGRAAREFNTLSSEMERVIQRIRGSHDAARDADIQAMKYREAKFFGLVLGAILLVFGALAWSWRRLVNGASGQIDRAGADLTIFMDDAHDMASVIPAQADSALGPVAASFDRYRSAIREALIVIARTTRAMQATAESLSTSSEKVSQSVSGIDRNLMTGTLSMDECMTILNNVDFLLQTSNDSTRQAASLSRIAMDRAVHGGKSVYATVEAMDKISDSVHKVEALVSSIQEIAAQTNLLAINTAIEASKAGEHGKGFAVIAEEVRKLAERSKKLTGEINTLMSEQQDRVLSGSNLAKNAGSSLDGIIKDVGAVTSLIQRIAAASAKHVETSAKLVSAMHTVSGSVRANAHEAQEVVRSSEHSNAEMHKLTTLVQDLSEVVGRFHLGVSLDPVSGPSRIPVIPTMPGASGIQPLPGLPEATREVAVDPQEQTTQKMELPSLPESSNVVALPPLPSALPAAEDKPALPEAAPEQEKKEAA